MARLPFILRETLALSALIGAGWLVWVLAAIITGVN
jgi:hypothetical protein